MTLVPDFINNKPTGRMMLRAMKYRFPNGMTDDSDHDHAWQVALVGGNVKPMEDVENIFYTAWCALCGALSIQADVDNKTRIIHYPTFIYGQGRTVRDMEAYKIGYAEAAFGLPLRDSNDRRNGEPTSALEERAKDFFSV